MNSKYQIIDNVLSKKDFLLIANFFTNNLKWNYSNSIVSRQSTNYMLDNYMFNHLFYNNQDPFTISKNISVIIPILNELNIYELYRCKSNFYARTEKIVNHDYHTDMNFKHLVALYFVNSNNGLTIIKNIAEIESIENRLLIFDGSLEHASTTSSDNVRINININFNQKPLEELKDFNLDNKQIFNKINYQ
jgi:hypothetical protein